MENYAARFIAAALAPTFWVLVFAVPLWLTRRFFPRAEKYLFGPLYNVGWLIGHTLRWGLRRVVRSRRA